MNIDKRKSIILCIIAIVTFVVLLVGATYAYFQATGGLGVSKDVKVTTYTSDLLTFTTGNEISITADQSNFAEGLDNQSGTSFVRAHLLANNKTNKASANYNVYLYIPDNSFVYTQEDRTPELLLQITDSSGNEVTFIDELDYKTVTDGKGNSVKGFDITTKLGMLTLANNHVIKANPESQEIWNISIVFVNLDANQNENTGKVFRGQLIITKDDYDNYTPAMVHTLSTNLENSSLTVSVNASVGTEGISKYYYAIKESNSVAMNTSNVTRLSNKLAVNDLEYIESDSNSYTFTNINTSSNYEVFSYVVDNKKTTSNIYKTKINSDLVVLPQITNVEVTNKTYTSITVSVTAIAGTNAIKKYYYSIDGGKTYTESNSSTYTFNNLIDKITYNIKVKVSDISDNYSYEFEINSSKSPMLITDACSNGNNLANCLKFYADSEKAKYTKLYHHNLALTNGAKDNSYRFAGSSDEVNNFVCFGSDAEICPDDNLYRIIGVFGDQVKLIKWDYAKRDVLGTYESYYNTYERAYGEFGGTSKGTNKPSEIGVYMWNVTGNNIWSTSELNTLKLNTNFLTNMGTTWVNKIATTTWKVGGNTYNNVARTRAATAYINEYTSPAENTTESKKIGLMYVSDYGFAASPSAWTTNLNSYGSSSITSNNWMYMGLYEWTMVRTSDTDNLIVYVQSGGDIANYSGVAMSVLAVRPVFYLNSNVTVFGNNVGSKSNPIRIN